MEYVNKQLAFLKANVNNLTIDADTHISDIENLNEKLLKKLHSTRNYYHGKPISAEELLWEMQASGVDMCLTWQNPAATVYKSNKKENFEALLKANTYIFESASKYPEKFIPAGWTDPKALETEDALKLAEICVNEFGFKIIKLNPAQNEFMLDSNDVVKVFEKIYSLGAIPAFHFAADTPYTPVSALEKLAINFAGKPLLAVHMGGGGSSYTEGEKIYDAARKIGLEYSNIKYIQSAKRDTHMESDFIRYQIAGEPYSKNIFCASDAPYGRQSWNFGGFKAMFKTLIHEDSHQDKRVEENKKVFNDEMQKNFLGRNFAEFYLGLH